MSKDTIYREDAIKALNREKSDWNCDYNVPIDNCIKRLNKVKSADRPQKKLAEALAPYTTREELMMADAEGKGYAEGFKDGLEADRLQGEWIRTGRTNIYGGIEVQCSNCGDKVIVQHLEDEWYCRHCGADMGMKGADNEDC